MFSQIGAGGFILIILVALLLFGPSKLPELGRAFGKTLREFKKGTRDIMSDEDEDEQKEVKRKEVQGSHSSRDDRDRDNDNRRLPD